MQLSYTLWAPLALLLHACNEPHPTDGPIDAYLEYEAGDFDGDQRADLVIVFPYYHPSFPPDQIVFNDGAEWTSRELWAGSSVSVGDFDGDGVDDVARFVAPHSLRDPAPLRVWIGGEHRDLSLAVEPQASREIVACARQSADYLIERSGEELLCTSYDAATYVYDHHVVVIDETIEVLPPGISAADDLYQQASADLDGDGAVDAVFTGRRPEGAALRSFRNLGGGQFEAAEQYGQGWAHHLSVGELDGAPASSRVHPARRWSPRAPEGRVSPPPLGRMGGRQARRPRQFRATRRLLLAGSRRHRPRWPRGDPRLAPRRRRAGRLRRPNAHHGRARPPARHPDRRRWRRRPRLCPLRRGARSGRRLAQ
ncbi:MAG: VCBS repeat-containing protein [Deltaproteobacteria bacterium]|nr:VCBS repeat-containing protein [Deltaproteobacteria bacterium]